MKLHYLAIAAVTAISANIGIASAAVSFLSVNSRLLLAHVMCASAYNKDFTRTLLPIYCILPSH
jgi:hypothetical protein